MSQTPPGWYPDSTGVQRWWDGRQWTKHTAPTRAPQPPAYPGWSGTPAYASPRRNRGLLAAVSGLGILVIAAAVVLVVLLTRGSHDDAGHSDDTGGGSVPAAETAVTDYLDGHSFAVLAQFGAAGVNPGGSHLECSPEQSAELGKASEYRVTDSHATGTGSAEVDVELKGRSVGLTVDVSEQSGAWRVTSLHCTG